MDELNTILTTVHDKYTEVFTSNPDQFLLINGYTYSLPAVSIVLYLMMVHVLPIFLRKYNIKWDNVKVRNAWNLYLTLLSIMMMLGVGVPYAYEIQRRGLIETMCDEEKEMYTVVSPSVFWVYTFALSKYAELIDTAFLVLNHKPVEFLHWYHHWTVLAFTWFAVYWRFSVGRVFIIVNATIHSFMYYYYWRMGECKLNPKLKKPQWAMFLTIGQTTQMVVGLICVATFAYLKHNGRDCACARPEILMVSCAVMFGSYLFLFSDFFYRRYIKGAKKADAKKKQ